MNKNNLKKRFKALDYKFDKEDLLFSILGFPILFIGSWLSKIIFAPFILLISFIEVKGKCYLEEMK